MSEEPRSPLRAADQYHAGIVADDPVATMAQPYWAYLRAAAGGGAGGPRLEIVSRTLEPMMEQHFETGSVR